MLSFWEIIWYTKTNKQAVAYVAETLCPKEVRAYWPWKHQGPEAPTKAVNFKCSLGNTKLYSVHPNERTKHDKITVGM